MPSNRRPKRGQEDLAPTWWAYAVLKFIKENGLSKGGFATLIGKDAGTVSRWLYEGKIPSKGTMKLIERTWRQDGWFARVRSEADRWLLRRKDRALARQHFESAQHSPAMWSELDDLLLETGIATYRTWPVNFDTACEMVSQARARLEEMAEGPLRERLEIELSAWSLAYGCD